jgi:uncharacterized membrane protein YqgA involved in biofilm formation
MSSRGHLETGGSAVFAIAVDFAKRYECLFHGPECFLAPLGSRENFVFGTIVNVLAITAGSLLGTFFRGGIPEKYNITVMHAISLAVMLVGLKSALATDAILLVIASMAIGSVIGEFARIEDQLEAIGRWLESRFSKSGGGIAKGFVTASLVFCVGSMAIVGSMESGLAGNHQTLFAKSILDGVASVIFASSLGIGVLFSAVSVFCYQGLITVTASLMKPFLTPEVVSQMSGVGGLLIFAIGFNLMEIKKIKVGNMLPAIFVPLVYFMLEKAIAAWF